MPYTEPQQTSKFRHMMTGNERDFTLDIGIRFQTYISLDAVPQRRNPWDLNHQWFQNAVFDDIIVLNSFTRSRSPIIRPQVEICYRIHSSTSES
jgi:hypothetical protein